MLSQKPGCFEEDEMMEVVASECPLSTADQSYTSGCVGWMNAQKKCMMQVRGAEE